MSSIIYKWEELCARSARFEFINIMLMGFSQIAFNCNPVCGFVLLASAAVASPIQLVSGVWAVFVAAVLAKVLKAPPEPVKEGLYTMNPALAGLALPLVMKTGDPAVVFMLSTVGAVLSVLLTGGLRKLLSRRQMSSLAAPYSLTLLFISLAVFGMRAMNGEPTVMAEPLAYSGADGILLSGREFCEAALNGVAQVMWIEGVKGSVTAGIVILAGIIAVSGRDALVTVYAVCLATCFAALLGLDRGKLLMGVYGYNAILLSLALFGREFEANRQTFAMITVLSMVSVVLAAVIGQAFSAVGAPAAAFPFLIPAMSVIAGKRGFGKGRG